MLFAHLLHLAQALLVADDEEVNYLYLEVLLKENCKINCKIIHAKNGKEAIMYCKETAEISIVFMDLKMPIIDGYEAMRAIKKIRPNLTIIAQTAYASDDDVKKILKSGFDNYLSKPIKDTVFKKLIKKYNLKPVN